MRMPNDRATRLGDAEVEVAGERLLLLAERAAFWSREAVLIVADTHWGKAASYRAASVAVPTGTTEDDLARMSRCLKRTGARRLLLLGDALHAKSGRAEATFAAVARWRARHPRLPVTLVRGNHDRHAGDPPPEWRFKVVDQPFSEGPFLFCHEPASHDGAYTLAGHVHPAVRLHGDGGEAERLPCFHFGPSVGILPAFGSFTGCATIRPMRGDRVFVIADDQIIRMA